MAELFLLDRSARTRRFSIGKELLRIGRAPSNTICIEDRCISAFHAEIAYAPAEGGHLLRDLGSLNATRVHGAVISEVALSPFEVLYLGDLLAVFLDPQRILGCASASREGPPARCPEDLEDQSAGLFAPRTITSWWGPVPRILLFVGPSGQSLLYPGTKEIVSVGPSEKNDVVVLDRELAEGDFVLRRLPERNRWVVESPFEADRHATGTARPIRHQRFNDVEVIDVGGLRCWLKSGGSVDASGQSTLNPIPEGSARPSSESSSGVNGSSPNGSSSVRESKPTISCAIPEGGERSRPDHRKRSAEGEAPPAEDPAQRLVQTLERPHSAGSRRRSSAPPESASGEGTLESPSRTQRLLQEKAATISRLRGELRETTEALWRMKKEKTEAARASAMTLILRENQLIEKLRHEKASLYALLER